MGSWNLIKIKVMKVFNNINNIKRQSQKITELMAERSLLLERLTENNKIIISLKTALDNNGEIVSENCAYWRKDGLGNIVEGPFCISCFITDSAFRPLVLVAETRNQVKGDCEWVQCIQCKLPFRQKIVGQYLKTQKSQKPTLPKTHYSSVI